MKPKELGALVLLGALWGSSYIFIRIAVPELGPFTLMGLRVGIAAVALSLYALAAARVPKLRYRWKQLVILGTFNAAIPFSLIATAELNLTASLAAILNSTTALSAAVVAAVWIGEPLTPKKIVGLFTGIAGVAVLVGWTPIPLTGIVLLSAGAVLVASFSYAIGGVYAKRTFEGIPPLSMAIGQQLGAATTLIPLGVISLPHRMPSSAAIFSMLAIALFCTAAAYLLYFYLIENAGPAKTLTVAFLIPAFGLIFGFLFLGEPIGLGTFVGLGIILFSVALVTGVSFGKGKEIEETRT